MFRRQKTGSIICPYCGKLVGAGEKECWNCGRRNPGLWGFASMLRLFGNRLEFVSVVIYGCAILYVATLLVDPHNISMQGISILSPSPGSLLIFGASGWMPVFTLDRWWTVLSAAWLHGGLLHILFNMLWIRQLAPATAELYGASRLVIIYTVSSITGFLLTSGAALVIGTSSLLFIRSAQLTVGASAPIFGLLGALVAFGQRSGSRHIGGQAMTYAAILFVFGIIMPYVDNLAHLGGFLGGYAVARMMNPAVRERFEHTITAIVCVALTLLSILASVITSGSLFR
ncbi:MAG TPA: rhomboid family intramembrane serine protease [Acidobacteriota bacterium]|nr:rhomboid family intramembrane serine protease [Acidobacteriota bacterium]